MLLFQLLLDLCLPWMMLRELYLSVWYQFSQPHILLSQFQEEINLTKGE